MGIVVFNIVSVIILSVTIYYSLKKKIHYPNCRSNNVVHTGKKQDKEDPGIAVFGSPDSYHELEYKCNNCGQMFWEK